MKCKVCGIGVRWLRLGTPSYSLNGPITERGVYVHTEPRTLANNLHNGSLDHDAVLNPDTVTGLDGAMTDRVALS